MQKFDTKVQNLKANVLKEVARHAWNGDLQEHLSNIPKDIISDNTATIRHSEDKELEILAERVKLAMGGNKDNPNVIEVIDAACDKCTSTGYQVSNVCRGCVAHRCEDVCPRSAISFDENNKAHIDKSKCINCGKCATVCPYSAIINQRRPCENACKIKAISACEQGQAKIDNDKCISCGACSYKCPFGAIADKSFIVNVIDMIKGSEQNNKYKVYAVVAPGIASQFVYAKIGQVVSGMKKLGFHSVVEAALGADIVAASECAELAETGFLTSSCCPAFVSYIRKQFPDLVGNISSNPSPMGATGKFLKEREPDAKVVFVGPCTAKKTEFQLPGVKEYVDAVITFEELQALFDSRDIDITTLDEDPLDDASYFGRIFAHSGGLAEAVTEGLKELGLSEKFDYKPVVCSGIDECKIALLKKQKGKLDENFIEGMACMGGCVNGAGCLTHSEQNKAKVDAFSKTAGDKTIVGVVNSLNNK